MKKIALLLIPLALHAPCSAQGCPIEILTSPPGSVLPGALQSDLVMRVFREHASLVPTTSVQVDHQGSGLLDQSADLQGGTIPAGTAVASWVLHKDTIALHPILRATITFDKPILGVIVRGSTLAASELPAPAGPGLGAPGTSYPANLQRGIELDSSLDNVALDGQSLYVELESPDFLDQVRVITEPGSSVVGVTCATAACGGNAGCPCGNDGNDPGAGCANSASQGAELFLGGPNLVALDAMSVVVSGLPANRNALLSMSATVSPAGTPFGAGKSCLGPGTIHRLQVFDTGIGVVAGGGLIGYVNTVVQPPNLIAPGTSWTFQVYYRDLVGVGTCPGSTANATNTVSIPFL